MFQRLTIRDNSSDRPSSDLKTGNRKLRPVFGLLLMAGLFSLLFVLTGCITGDRFVGDLSGWNPLVSSGNVVYVGTKEGQVRALVDNGLDGYSVSWAFPPVGSAIEIGGVYSTPLVVDGLVYVGALDGYLYALDIETGSVTDRGWRRPEGQPAGLHSFVSGPAYDPVNELVLVTSEDGKLYGYDADTGAQIWDPFPTGDRIWSTPAVDNAVAYFGSHDHRVYAVRAADGEQVWSYETGGVVAGKPLVVDGKVIVGSFDRKLYALDAADGDLVWSFEGGNWFWAGSVSDGRTIYAPNMDGMIYALSLDGFLQWSHDMGSAIVSPPVLVPQGLVVAARDGEIRLLDVGSSTQGLGRELSQFTLNDAEVRAPLVARGDSVYVGAQDGSVRRIQARSAGHVQMWCWHVEKPQC